MNREQLKDYREIREMSQQQLADLLGISVSRLRAYEQGMRNGKPVKIPKWLPYALVGLKQIKGI